MPISFKVSALLTIVTVTLSLQLVNAAPTLKAIEVRKADGSDSPFRPPIHYDICAGFYLEPPCILNLELVQGGCLRIPRNLAFSSIRYDKGITCTLYSGTTCDALGSAALEHIVLPYDVISDLSRVGWNKKANSMYCKWDDALTKRSSLEVTARAPTEVSDAHHHNHDPMYVDLCEDNYYHGQCLRQQKLYQGDCGTIQGMGVSSIQFSSDLICLLYESSNCGAGDSLSNVVLHGRVDDLATIGWNDRARSIACLFANDFLEEGSPLVTEPPRALTARNIAHNEFSIAHHRRDFMHITLYDNIGFEDIGPESGFEFVIEPELCIELRNVNFERRTSSINFERGPVCTFFETGSCNGGPTLVLAIGETNLKPFHTDDWKSWNDRISSFSCVLKHDLLTRDASPDEVSITEHFNFIYLTLYEHIQFNGHAIEFIVEPNVCNWLFDETFENITSSIKFERGPSCTFYETNNCNLNTGEENNPTLELAIEETNLKPFHTDDWKTWNDRIGSFSCVWKNGPIDI